jgi:DeoR family fructose operon transcriptional repressor
MLLADERQRYIFERATSTGGVRIVELAELLNVSVETIRRDINILAEAGKLRKVHGGAVPFDSVAGSSAAVKRIIDHEPVYSVRAEISKPEKDAIGRRAAKLISSGDVIMLDAGLTTQALARAIRGVERVTIFTNAIPIASVLLDKLEAGDFDGRIVFVGGTLDVDNRYAGGAVAFQTLSSIYADKAFVSTTSVSADGFHMYNIDEGAITAKLISNSGASYVLAESAKFARSSSYKFAELSAVNAIVTEPSNPIAREILDALSDAGTEIIMADPQP